MARATEITVNVQDMLESHVEPPDVNVMARARAALAGTEGA